MLMYAYTLDTTDVYMCVCLSVCLSSHYEVSTHINPGLLSVVLLLVEVNKALPIDLELGTLWYLAYRVTELLLAMGL